MSTTIFITDIVHRDLKLENILVASESGDEESPLYDIKVQNIYF